MHDFEFQFEERKRGVSQSAAGRVPRGRKPRGGGAPGQRPRGVGAWAEGSEVGGRGPSTGRPVPGAVRSGRCGLEAGPGSHEAAPRGMRASAGGERGCVGGVATEGIGAPRRHGRGRSQRGGVGSTVRPGQGAARTLGSNSQPPEEARHTKGGAAFLGSTQRGSAYGQKGAKRGGKKAADGKVRCSAPWGSVRGEPGAGPGSREAAPRGMRASASGKGGAWGSRNRGDRRSPPRGSALDLADGRGRSQRKGAVDLARVLRERWTQTHSPQRRPDSRRGGAAFLGSTQRGSAYGQKGAKRGRKKAVDGKGRCSAPWGSGRGEPGAGPGSREAAPRGMRASASGKGGAWRSRNREDWRSPCRIDAKSRPAHGEGQARAGAGLGSHRRGWGGARGREAPPRGMTASAGGERGSRAQVGGCGGLGLTLVSGGGSRRGRRRAGGQAGDGGGGRRGRAQDGGALADVEQGGREKRETRNKSGFKSANQKPQLRRDLAVTPNSGKSRAPDPCGPVERLAGESKRKRVDTLSHVEPRLSNSRVLTARRKWIQAACL